jgi:hypothetical protein
MAEHPDAAKDESGDAQDGKNDVDDLQCRIHGDPDFRACVGARPDRRSLILTADFDRGKPVQRR